MIELLFSFPGGLDENLEVGFDGFLAHKLIEVARTEVVFEKKIFFGPDRTENCFCLHLGLIYQGALTRDIPYLSTFWRVSSSSLSGVARIQPLPLSSGRCHPRFFPLLCV